MLIYHYTSIGNLELILKSQKIRFKPLSSLACTQQESRLPEYIAKSIYVSCWTTQSEESLEKWERFTGKSGVRLELPKQLYRNYELTSRLHLRQGGERRIKYPFSVQQLSTESYHIAVNVFYENGFFVEVTYGDLLHGTERDGKSLNGDYLRVIDPETLVAYKDPKWKFEHEGRFYLTVIPHKETYPEFVDMDLEPEVLDRLKVRMHPESSAEDLRRVKVLLAKYTQDGGVEVSQLASRP